MLSMITCRLLPRSYQSGAHLRESTLVGCLPPPSCAELLADWCGGELAADGPTVPEQASKAGVDVSCAGEELLVLPGSSLTSMSFRNSLSIKRF